MALLDIFRKHKRELLSDDTLIVAIGDIHGDFNELINLLAQLQEKFDGDSTYSTKEIVFLGDYVDRGMQSKQVLDFLIEDDFLPDWQKIYLAGNHEKLVLKAINERDYYIWLKLAGGRQTIASYDVDVTNEDAKDSENEAMLERFCKIFPATHKAFLESLTLSHTKGEYFFAHAGINPKASLTTQREEDLLWIRKPFLTSKKRFGKTIIHGHTPVSRPEIKANRIGIDTGCARGGFLTCVILTKGEVNFLSTSTLSG
jgi:serine/threonine protein phosphatase 1